MQLSQVWGEAWLREAKRNKMVDTTTGLCIGLGLCAVAQFFGPMVYRTLFVSPKVEQTEAIVEALLAIEDAIHVTHETLKLSLAVENDDDEDDDDDEDEE